MKHQKYICLFVGFVFVGMGLITFGPGNSVAGEWKGGFEAFKPATDAKYHQRNTGNIPWNSFEELPAEETKNSTPNFTDIFWIEGEKGWVNRIRKTEKHSRLAYQEPANLSADKYHSPCPICGFDTYFWLDNGFMDSKTLKTIQVDNPSWTQDDGICRNCFENYTVTSGTWYDGKVASTTDEYVIGYNKSKYVQDYFKNVK
ncbi:MAG: hypothetical protein MRK01_17075 [Candidatus Scalindua sp.]|nr:hypothetical protein [Candidatus Scalindua sp.]